MKTTKKEIIIHSTPEKIFTQMDDFSKTGMHMSESSMMMMGSKLKLEQLSINPIILAQQQIIPTGFIGISSHTLQNGLSFISLRIGRRI